MDFRTAVEKWLGKKYPQLKVLDAHSLSQTISVVCPKAQPVIGYHTMPGNCIPSFAMSSAYPPIEEGDTAGVTGALQLCAWGMHGDPTLARALGTWRYGPIISKCAFWGNGVIDLRGAPTGPLGKRRWTLYIDKWCFRNREHRVMVDTAGFYDRQMVKKALKVIQAGSKNRAVLEAAIRSKTVDADTTLRKIGTNYWKYELSGKERAKIVSRHLRKREKELCLKSS